MSEEVEFVRGKRLHLRELQRQDLDGVSIALADWYGDTGYVTEDGVINFMRGVTSKHNYIKRPYTKDTNHYETFAICLNDTGDFVGFRRFRITGLTVTSMMVCIIPEHRGNKYHSESILLCLQVFFDVFNCKEYNGYFRGNEKSHPSLYWILKKNGGFMEQNGEDRDGPVGTLTGLSGTKADWDEWKKLSGSKLTNTMKYKGAGYLTPAQREEKKIKLI